MQEYQRRCTVIEQRLKSSIKYIWEVAIDDVEVVSSESDLLDRISNESKSESVEIKRPDREERKDELDDLLYDSTKTLVPVKADIKPLTSAVANSISPEPPAVKNNSRDLIDLT